MTLSLSKCAAAVAMMFCCCAAAVAEDFNSGWKFSLSPDGESASQRAHTQAAQREAVPAQALPDYDDSAWRAVDLPHDWSVEGAPHRDNPAGNDGGYYPAGIGWYRKTFDFKPDVEKSLTTLYFEGVYMNAAVFVNGQHVGTRPYGYSSFYYDISPYLHEGRNVVAVRVDNSAQKNCRWYSGSGIYRGVRLLRSAPLHFEPWGICVRSRLLPGGSAEVTVLAQVTNARPYPVKATVEAWLCPHGTKVDFCRECVSTAPLSLAQASFLPGESKEMTLRFCTDNPRLWSPSSPELYSLVCTLMEADGTKMPDRLSDVRRQDFGIRTVEYSAQAGLLLNGEPLKLNGGCLHHDNGPLGAAAYRDAEWRKVRQMKEAGFNAVRTSHNPPSETFLDACDSLGLLVIDESFDGWRAAKTPHDYSTLFDRWWTEDVEAMVLRDRNHPSVFCWSTGNEIIERKESVAVLTAHALAGLVRRLDPTRPVTSALAAWDSDWEIYDPLAAAHDIVGYNYMMHKGPSDHERVPDRVMMQTESYPRDAFQNWKRLSECPYIIGDFVWTAIDYLGESGIGRYYYEGQTPGEHYQADQFPWHGAYCGDIDLTGWRKPVSHYRDMLYNPDNKLYMAVREPDGYYGAVRETQWSVWPTWESWNWPGHEGKPIEVEVCSRYPSVRLYQNGKLVEERSCGIETGFKAVFTIPYRSGKLVAAGVENGVEVEKCTLETAGKPARIRLSVEPAPGRESGSVMPADGQSLCYVIVEVTDSRGSVVPDADALLEFTLDGPAGLLATASADLTDCTPYTFNSRKAWKGRAMAVVKAGLEPGTARLTVRAKGLRPADLEIEIR